MAEQKRAKYNITVRKGGKRDGEEVTVYGGEVIPPELVQFVPKQLIQGEPTEPKLDVPNGVKAFGVKSEDEGE